MRHSKGMMVLVLIVITGGFLFAGGGKETDAGKEEVQVQTTPLQKELEQKTIVLTDCNGKEIELTVPVKRAVALAPGSTLSVIKAIHAEDQVVGVLDSIKDKPSQHPFFSTLESIGTTESPNFEAILSLDPDIIIVPYWITDEVEQKLNPEIPVFRLNIGPPLTYKEDVNKLACIFGEEENAETYITWCEDLVNGIIERTSSIPENEKPKVFDFYGGDWGMSAGPPYGTYGKDNFWVAPMIDMAGGINISGDLPGDWMTVDPEWVIEANPDIIIRELFSMISGKDVTGYEANDSIKMAAMRREIMQESSLETTKAVKSERVYMIEGSLIQGTWFLGLQYMAKWFHPDLFTDLDPQAVHQEYLERFQRIDFDVTNQGAFVFPEY